MLLEGGAPPPAKRGCLTPTEKQECRYINLSVQNPLIVEEDSSFNDLLPCVGSIIGCGGMTRNGGDGGDSGGAGSGGASSGGGLSTLEIHFNDS